MDHETRATIDQLFSKVNDLGTRVTVLETNYRHIDTRLSKIEGGQDRLFWTVVGAVVVAAATFVLKGGLVGIIH
jgi:hypothetical protein